MVYFVQAGPNGPIKIGYTAGSPSARVAALQTGNHVPLFLVGVIPGGQWLERQLHARFVKHRGVGEWFSPCPELIALIDGINLAGDASERAEIGPELGITGIEFSKLVEEVAMDIVSRRNHAAAEASAEPKNAERACPEPEFETEANEGVA